MNVIHNNKNKLATDPVNPLDKKYIAGVFRTADTCGFVSGIKCTYKMYVICNAFYCTQGK